MAPPPAEDPEELVDYDDEAEEPYVAPTTAAPAAAGVDGGDADKKGSYVGIHSTGFRDFLLKPEILRAISDLGFEHPSEGLFHLTLTRVADIQSSRSAFPRPFLAPMSSVRPSRVWVRRRCSSLPVCSSCEWQLCFVCS